MTDYIDPLADLAERLTQAAVTVDEMATAPAGPDENSTAMALRMLRLSGKVDGLKVALSYVMEAQRAQCPAVSGGSMSTRCLLRAGHEGWHGAIAASWTNREG